MDTFEKARGFIYKNARPIDLARWNYLYENGSRDEVIKYLLSYQNEDGGFANALEPDCWNKKSIPIQTWLSTRIIKEIGLENNTHPLILGILDYLSSGTEFDGHLWHGLNSVKSNNDYPHAPWWSYLKDKETSYNPTASLVGFIIKYADENSPIYYLACELSKEAFVYFKNNYPLESFHEISCFVDLYEYLKDCEIQGIIDLEEFRILLKKQINKMISYNVDSWSTEYVCKPSQFIQSKKSDFYSSNEDICDFEYKFIKQSQNDDGTWNVTWNWNGFEEQWPISKNWWKSNIIIKNISYLKAFETK